MIWTVEWKRLFSALKSLKSALYGYPPKFHFSEKFSWLTCLDIFSQVGQESQLCGKQHIFILYSWIFL